MRIQSKTSKLIVSLISMAFMVSGCNNEDLKAVEEFGLMSAVIKQSSSNIIKDIYYSCVRTKEINSKEVFINDDIPKTFPPLQARQDCLPFREVVATTAQLNVVLVDYVESLGRLASNNTVLFNENLKSLGNSINNFGLTLSSTGLTQVTFGEKQIDASTNIVNSLLNLWSAQFRHENLKQALICTDPYLKTYTSLLIEIIQTAYITGNLQSEEESTNLYFDTAYKTSVRSLHNNTDQLTAAMTSLNEKYNQQIKEIDQKKEAAIAYIQILETTAQTHYALANQYKGKLSPEEEKVFCANYFSEANNQVNQTQIKIPEQNTEQLKQVRKIFGDYLQDIKPLVKKINKKF